jgi:transposase InsO family protein
MTDTGANGMGFINRTFALENRLQLRPLDKTVPLRGFNGEISTGDRITHGAQVTLRIRNHKEHIWLLVTNLGEHDIILGWAWMKQHGVIPDYRNQAIKFTAERCSRQCLIASKPEPRSQPKLNNMKSEPLKPRKPAISPEKVSSKTLQPDSRKPAPKLDRQRSNPKPDLNFDHIPTRHSEPKPKKSPEPLNRRFDHQWKQELKEAMKWARETESESESELCPQPELEPEPEPELETDSNLTMDIYQIGSAPFMRLARKSGYELFAASITDIEKTLAPKKHTDPVEKVPTEYHEFLDVFSRKESEKLPEHRPYDHKFNLESGKQPPFGPLYGMSLNELKCLRKYLKENLSKGFIRASTSPVAAPVLFAKKPGGGLRFCVDYRALNAITVKNRYPIPLIQETLNRLSKAKFYTKLDIIAAFNRLRIAKGDEWLTAFRTRYGLFEYLVMPFGLANAPSTFQHYVNDVLRSFLDIFCTAYIDDILIYSDNLKDHRKHVRSVLQALREAGLQLDVDKCEFHQTEVLYLGLLISTEGIRMDPAKIKTVLEWEPPKNVKDVQSFIGFANFYRRFIQGFSKIVTPLIALTRKDTKFDFSEICHRAFNHLKERFVTAPILQHFDPDLPCVVEADSSDHVSAGVLSQYGKDGILRPVAYFSKRLIPAECNYEIYDKELLAIIRCFEQWRPELEGAAFPIKVLSDHRNLQYFTTTKLLSHRQARWSEYLSRFNFVIVYRPGSQGQKPDALTRRTQDTQALDDARAHRNQTLLRPDLFQSDSQFKLDPELKILNATLAPTETNRTPEQIIEEEYPNDDFIQEIMNLIRSEVRRSRKITLSECTIRDDKLYYQDRLVIPDHDELKLKLLRYVHDSPVGGHAGRAKTLELLQRQYYWPLMHETVRRYVGSCHICSRSKASREKYHGLLKPLPVPERRWKHISVDFVVELPECRTRSSVMVVTCRLSKMVHFVSCPDLETPTVARLFLKHVWKHHGLPDSIVSDRGTQFISAFWDELTRQLKIDARLSTAYHPETDGQTERTNAVMEQYLRAYVSYMQDDWINWLPMAEFTFNNTESATTKVSPFLANSGQHPRMGFEPPTERPRPHHQAVQARDANRFVDTMSDLNERLRSEMKWAQAVYESNANRTRNPAPAYRVGDYVWLDARNIKTRRPSKKLDWKNIGPFPVTQVVSPYAYRLQLPDSMKIHNVFHTNLLRPAAEPETALPGQLNDPPPAVEVDGEQEWFIERIEDSRHNRRRRQYEYLVKWVGYDELTWEPYEFVKEAAALTEYYSRYPTRPRPDDYEE